VAILGAVCAWLQMSRWLTVALAGILAGVFVVMELLLTMRARQEAHDRD
jgi:hypothetical protein